jgi:flagellar FliJ protein
VNFTFRYESLLSYKGHLKEKAETDFSIAQRRLRQCRQKLEEYEKGLNLAHDAFADLLRQRVPSSLIKTYAGYIAAMETKIQSQKAVITKAEQIVAEKLRILLLKTKEYKVFEKLKERDFKQWSHQQNRTEQKEISETALLRYGREFLGN